MVNNYLNETKLHFDDNTFFCCDKLDIVKPYCKKLEALDRVRDVSTGETEKGYDTFDIPDFEYYVLVGEIKEY